MFNQVNPKQNFSELEERILQFWKKNKIFEKSVKSRPVSNKYVFYDGPPFITGTPHYGSLLSRIAKDVVPRYWTMNGRCVERQWGWDCHGLPIENKVEGKLGLKNRKDIEKVGVEKFIEECYRYTRETSAEWEWYKDKVGQWVDFENAYKTMDQDFMETVWWVFKTLYEKDLIYEGVRTSLYCTRCGTPISNFEIAMDNSYADMEDPAVTIRFPLKEDPDVSVLAWTTTPWTLPANRALVVDPNEDYVRVKVKKLTVILAKKCLNSALENMEYEIIKEFKGKELIGKGYIPPYDFFAPNDKDLKIYSYSGMVTMDEGVGIVHSAPGFGDIDTEMGQSIGLTIMMNVNEEGKFVDAVKPWAGMYVKDADNHIIADLKQRGLLFKLEKITHRYPYCYRCGTPLIHKAQKSWFIKINALKDKMLKNNENINWVPDRVGTGRFKKGVEVAPDWCISRTRYWATPMPVWRSDDKENPETIVVGSRDELRNLTNEPITKIIFIIPGETDLEGKLTAKGWDDAREIERVFGNEVNHIYVSDIISCQEMVQPISEGKKKIKINVETNLGSSLWEKDFAETKEKILTDYKVETLSDVDEKILKQEFEFLQDLLKEKILEINKKHEGMVILISVTSNALSLIRNAFQPVTLRVAFRTNPLPGKWKNIFFSDGVELDLHKPMIDKFTIKSLKSGKTLKRIFEVCDVWLDSGSMPYAMKHYPFENKKEFEENFPADFVVEYIAQTRAWFYVMHVISTALFNSHSFKNVVNTGVMAGTDGRKMSKSYGNYPDPKETILKYGGDALRLYFMGSKIMLAEDISFSEESIVDQIKTILLPLWNSYSFFITYANLHKFKPSPDLVKDKNNDESWAKLPFNPKEKLNIWILAKLQLTIRNIREAFEEYNLPKVVKEYPEFISYLSKWYIRRSRNKFSEGDKEYLRTLYYVLVEFIKLLAPLAPFITEGIYQNLVKIVLPNQKESIHLSDFPDDDTVFLEKSTRTLLLMDIVREIVNLGQFIRVENGIRVRQPLSELEIAFDTDPSRDFELENWMVDLISKELNIKAVRESKHLNNSSGWEMAESSQYKLKISLNTNIDDNLRREGILRELQRGIQSQRKKISLNTTDKVSIDIKTKSDIVIEVINGFHKDLATFVNAISIKVSKQNPTHKVIKVEGEDVDISVTKV